MNENNPSPERPFYRPRRAIIKQPRSLWDDIIEPALAFIGVLAIIALVCVGMAKL